MKSKIEVKNQWKQFIAHQQPTVLVTLSLRKIGRGVISDEGAVKIFNQLIWFANRSLFRKRHDKGFEYLAGFAALEHQDNGMPHVHIMITNDIDVDKLRKIFEKHIHRIVWKQRGRNYKVQKKYRKLHQSGIEISSMKDEVLEKCQSKIRLMLPEGLDVRPIGQTEEDFLTLSGYLLKENAEYLFLDRHGLGLPIELMPA